jgi:hypothetical protein
MSSAVIPALSAKERQALSTAEATIEGGLGTFVEVGTALLQIRDKKLYRESHRTFEDYCGERWGMSRRYAYNQIEAAEICAQLRTPPANEAVTRELAPLKDNPKAMQAALARATNGNGKPTAKAVRQAVLYQQIGPQSDVSAKKAARVIREDEGLARAVAKGERSLSSAHRTLSDREVVPPRGIQYEPENKQLTGKTVRELLRGIENNLVLIERLDFAALDDQGRRDIRHQIGLIIGRLNSTKERTQ